MQIEKLQALLQDTEMLKTNFTNFVEMPLPLDPAVRVTGIIPQEATLFNVSPSNRALVSSYPDITVMVDWA